MREDILTLPSDSETPKVFSSKGLVAFMGDRDEGEGLSFKRSVSKGVVAMKDCARAILHQCCGIDGCRSQSIAPCTK